MRVLYLGLWLGTFFFYLFPFFYVFKYFAVLQAIHCHYQSQASSMPSKEEWFTYDTTVFLHLNNHIHNQGKVMQERNWWWTWTAHNGISKSSFTNSHFFFFFSFCVTLICPFSTSASGYAAAPRPKVQPLEVSHSSVLVVLNLDGLKKIITSMSSPCLRPLPNAVQCSAKWSQIAVGWQDCPAAVQHC